MMEVRHIPNLTGDEVPGGTRMCRKLPSPKRSYPAASPQDLKSRCRHKVIETFSSTDITTPHIHDFNSSEFICFLKAA